MSRRAEPDDQVASLIDGLSPEVAPLARRGLVRRYRKGRILIEEGDRGDAIYIVLSGRLRVYACDAGSDREVVHGHHGPGEIVGEMSLDGGARTASVMVAETACCAMVTRLTLLAYLRECPEFALVLMSKLIARARASTHSVTQMAFSDVCGRVRVLLESLPRVSAAADVVTVSRLPHREVAARVVCSREMASKVLKNLERIGHLRAQRGYWEVRLPLPQRW